MPAFQWFDGVIAHNFSGNVESPEQVVWPLLRNLPTGLYYIASDHPLTLRMYSGLEYRWLDIAYIQTVGQTWPYMDVEQFINEREKLYEVIHSHGDGFVNPCNEILVNVV